MVAANNKPRQSFSSSDARSRVFEKEQHVLQLRAADANAAAGPNAAAGAAGEPDAMSQWEGMIIAGGAEALFAVVSLGALYLMLKYWPESW